MTQKHDSHDTSLKEARHTLGLALARHGPMGSLFEE